MEEKIVSSYVLDKFNLLHIQKKKKKSRISSWRRIRNSDAKPWLEIPTWESTIWRYLTWMKWTKRSIQDCEKWGAKKTTKDVQQKTRVCKWDGHAFSKNSNILGWLPDSVECKTPALRVRSSRPILGMEPTLKKFFSNVLRRRNSENYLGRILDSYWECKNLQKTPL